MIRVSEDSLQISYNQIQIIEKRENVSRETFSLLIEIYYSLYRDFITQ